MKFEMQFPLHSCKNVFLFTRRNTTGSIHSGHPVCTRTSCRPRGFSGRPPRASFHPLPTKAISSSLGAVLKFNDSRKSRKFRDSCFFINVYTRIRGNNVKVCALKRAVHALPLPPHREHKYFSLIRVISFLASV